MVRTDWLDNSPDHSTTLPPYYSVSFINNYYKELQSCVGQHFLNLNDHYLQPGTFLGKGDEKKECA